MPKEYSDDDLAALTPDQLWGLYENARRLKADALAERIRNTGRLRNPGGLRFSDPDYLEMEEIINSKEGKAVAKNAADQGYPALCGVDVVLQQRMGDRYGSRHTDTADAGDLVKKMMEREGYRTAGHGSCPPEWKCRVK